MKQLSRSLNNIRVKDFIEIRQGLIFAVVAAGEAGKILCFLRYAYSRGRWRKVATEDANRLLAENFPRYLFYSKTLDANLHAVSPAEVVRHYSSTQGLQALLNSAGNDPVLADYRQLYRMLISENQPLPTALGVTGSLLLGLQNPDSDIDLVCYDRGVFNRLRERLESLLLAGKCQSLRTEDWLASYKRRDCHLSLEDYIWHEQRKNNKALINNRKFDLSLVTLPPFSENGIYRKLRPISLTAQVLDDYHGFDYPAEFKLKHPEIDSVVSFTATYTGQARAGETIEIAGQLEIDQRGRQRVVVGSSREAIGEYIKVIREF
ncbi:MAG: nucleotidyltransferase domain-containing protein [Methylomonas sp.]